MSRQLLSTGRYFCWFSLAAALATAARAQVVNDGATNTLSNVTNSFTGDVTVGTNGSFTLLVLSDNVLLTNSLNGVIGRNSTAKSNEVRLISSTARWRVGGTLFVGSNGVANRLVVSNGAFVKSGGGSFAFRLESSNNTALITDPGSLWSNRNNLDIGGLGRGNQMIVSNGGWVISRNARLGVDATGSNNFALVSGAGSVWSNALNLSVGNIAPGNRLVIEAGGLVNDDTGLVGDFNSASNNEVLVTGSGSLWINRSSLTIGSQMPRNRLIVSNGAAVWSGNATIGSFGSLGNNNSVLLTDVGTLWSNQNDLIVGNSGFGNQLAVSNGAILVTSNLFVGFQSFSTNNRVVVDGGTLRITNGTTSGLLDVRRGTNVLNAGLVEVDQLLVTNTSGRFEFNGGTLSVNQSTVNNGQLFRVGNGVSAASFDLAGIGTHTFANGLTISPNATINMEISKNGSVLTNDQIAVTGPLTYGGTLTVTKLGPTTLAVGDKFKLFSASSFAGFFGLIDFSSALPPPGATWTNKLLVDGSFEVIGFPPTVSTLSATAINFTNATLNGFANPRGSSTSAWFEWGATTNYGNLTPLQALGGGTSTTNFNADISSLTLGAVYHFRAVASNSFGVVRGTNQSFVTLGAPSVQTLAASEINTNTATFNGLANPRGGSNTFAWFEWGATTNYGNVTPLHALGGDLSDTNFSAVLSDLTAEVQYHFRAVASNSLGFVAFGTDRFFITRFFPKEITYLKASNTGVDDFFGRSVRISGDTVVVGAYDEDSNATGVNGNQSNNSAPGAGAAYVFVRNGTNWMQQAYLKASNTGANDLFGISVAISGNTIVVGAYGEASNATGVNGNQSNNSTPLAGAAYVFVRNGTNWTQQAYLKASNTDSNTFFGISVAISGDTVVIGADSDASNVTGINGNQGDRSAPNAGAAYVFVRNGTNWTQQAYLKASNTQSNDSFGGSVAISGDTIVVGASGEDSAATGINGNQSDDSAPNSGAAYVFMRTGTNWSQQAYLKASNTDSNDLFSSVAISGDTVVVGAIFEASNATGVNGNQANNSAIQAGAAYVFVRNGTNWTQQAYLKASNTDSGDHFGRTAVSGHTVVIGANLEASNAKGINGNQTNNSAGQAGAAYVFLRSGTNWTQQAYLKASNTDPDDFFGGSVTVSGSTVVVGAAFEDSNATGTNGDQSDNSASLSGAAYVFDLSLLNPTAPVLSTTPSGTGQVTLSWNPPTPGFALQESLNLAPVSWSNSPSGETNPINLPISEQTKFFRLFKP